MRSLIGQDVLRFGAIYPKVMKSISKPRLTRILAKFQDFSCESGNDVSPALGTRLNFDPHLIAFLDGIKNLPRNQSIADAPHRDSRPS